MKSMINRTHIEGYVYEHTLELKVSGPNSKTPGTEFIMGNLNIATDSECLNVVPVHFTYVTATTSKGGANNTFAVLKSIIDRKIGTVMADGKDKAGKVRIDSAVGLNDFYTERNGNVELVSAKRNEGGFIHSVDVLAEDEKTRNTFECDMLITGTTFVDGDPERNTNDKVVVRGAIFDFRKALMPVEFTATNPAAMNYFESLGASSNSPIFTKVWGRQISQTVSREIREETAFGEDNVKYVNNSHKDWVITGASKEPYLWDDESSITAVELKEAMANRETYLATVKARYDEYQATKNAPAAANASTGFNF